MALTQIDPSMIPTDAIDASKIAAGAVGTAEIADGAVGQAEMASDAAGKGPAFSAYQSSAQALSATVATKVNFQAEEFDTANCFDTTNGRFTPNVAGYYRVTAAVQYNTTPTTLIVQLYKNGANIRNLFYTTGNVPAGAGSALVYMNGTTDYLEIYATIGASQNLTATAPGTYFQASLERAA